MALTIRGGIVIGLAVFFLTAVTHSLGQTEEKDKRDALRVGRQVSRYLQQNQDVRPLLRKYAVKNFLDYTVDDHLFNVFAALDENLLPQLDQKTRDAYYISASNWFYLAIAYTCTQKPKKNAYGGDDLVFPPGVEKLMRGKPVLSTFLHDSDKDMPKPKTIEVLKKVVADLEEVNSIYRRYLKSLKQKPFYQYLSILKKANGGGEKFFTTEVSKCDNSFPKCPGLPAASRLILVSVPGIYFVQFARVNGSMKILHIYQGPGD